MKMNPSHKKNIDALRRIEGQVRGIQRMIESRRYCVDILTQISAVNNALMRVQENILQRHLNSCVSSALKGKSVSQKNKKIDEIFLLLKQFRKNG